MSMLLTDKERELEACRLQAVALLEGLRRLTEMYENEWDADGVPFLRPAWLEALLSPSTVADYTALKAAPKFERELEACQAREKVLFTALHHMCAHTKAKPGYRSAIVKAALELEIGGE